MTTIKQVIDIEEICTVSTLLVDGIDIKLHNIVLFPKCDSNLISLGQLLETGIIHHNNLVVMMLIK